MITLHKCIRCSNPAADGLAFCDSCLEGIESEEAAMENEPERNWSDWFLDIACIACLIITALIGAALIVFALSAISR